MNVIFSSTTGLSILAIDDELIYIDDELNVYDRFSVESFGIDTKETLKRFIIATKRYFKDFKFKQFETLAYKQFANSDFVKQIVKEIKEEQLK